MNMNDEKEARPNVHPLLRRGQAINPAVPSLEDVAAPEPWTADALCAEIDNDIFFPEKGGSTREAKRICALCPVADDCLEYALRHGERFGIWGGVSERDRRRLTHQRAAS